MGIIYSSSPIFIILISTIFFKEKINIIRIIGVITCTIGVITIIVKGKISLLIELNFTSGDLWMLGASIGWALYTIYLFYWKSSLPLLERFTLIAMFGAISLLPFFILEHIYFSKTSYDFNFLFWVLFAAISPSIIAFYYLTMLITSLVLQLQALFYIYILCMGQYMGYFSLMRK